MKTQFSLKQLLATNLLTLLAVCLLTATLVIAPATINVYLDDLPASATYVVKTDGSGNYWSIRSDGYKYAESPEAYSIINGAITAASSVKGSVYLTKGLYTMNSPVVMKNNVTLDGTWGAILRAANGLDSSVVFAEDVHYWTVKNIQIDGNRFNQDRSGWPSANGITAWDTTHFVIENCFIHDVYSFGISVQPNTASGAFTGYGLIQHNVISLADMNGMQIGGFYASPLTAYNVIANNIVRDCCDIGIDDVGTHNLFIGNTVEFTSALTKGRGAANSYWGLGTEGSSPCGKGSSFIGNKVVYLSNCPLTDVEFSAICHTASGGDTLFEDNTIFFEQTMTSGYALGYMLHATSDSHVIVRGGSVISTGSQMLQAFHIQHVHKILIEGVYIRNFGTGFSLDASAEDIVARDITFETVTTNFGSGDIIYHDCFDVDTSAWIADV